MPIAIRIIAGLIVLAIIAAMVGPFGSVEAASGISDKIAHVAAFAIIPICLAIVFPFGRLSTLAIVSMLLGGAIEIVQGWVGRDADWLDWAADGVGVLIAVMILGALRWRNARRTA